MRKIGELLDAELLEEYKARKAAARDTKIMQKGLSKGRNYGEMEEIWNKSEHTDSSGDSPLARHSKSKSLNMSLRKSTMAGSKNTTGFKKSE